MTSRRSVGEPELVPTLRQSGFCRVSSVATHTTATKDAASTPSIAARRHDGRRSENTDPDDDSQREHQYCRSSRVRSRDRGARGRSARGRCPDHGGERRDHVQPLGRRGPYAGRDGDEGGEKSEGTSCEAVVGVAGRRRRRSRGEPGRAGGRAGGLRSIGSGTPARGRATQSGAHAATTAASAAAYRRPLGRRSRTIACAATRKAAKSVWSSRRRASRSPPPAGTRRSRARTCGAAKSQSTRTSPGAEQREERIRARFGRIPGEHPG